MQLKRTFLLGVIGSLSFSALLGIWAFLFSTFGELEVKIILTTLTAALFSLTSLGAAVVAERGRWRPAMIATFVISGIGLVIYLLAIWVELWRYVDDDWLAKGMFWIGTWAVAMPHMALLSLAPLKGAYLWIRRSACACVFLLASSITLFALFEGEPDPEFWFRTVGVFGILTALGTITVPVLVKVVGIDKEAGVESTSLDIQITCPRCLLQQTVRSGHSRCKGCKLRIEINIEEPRCPRCDYLLHKLTTPVCPECGYKLGDEELVGEPAVPATGET